MVKNGEAKQRRLKEGRILAGQTIASMPMTDSREIKDGLKLAAVSTATIRRSVWSVCEVS